MKELSADDANMAILYIVHGCLTCVFAANLTNTVNCDRLLKDAVPAVSFIPENTLNHARREGEAFSWYLEIFFSEFG